MKQRLQQVYRDLSAGKLSKAAALEIIEGLKRQQHGPGVGVVLASPQWQAAAQPGESIQWPYAQQHLLLCELPGIDPAELSSLVPHSRCQILKTSVHGNVAERYSDYAAACFETLQNIFRSKPQAKVLVRIVLPDAPEQSICMGLSALLKTATLENPNVVGQCVLVAPDITVAALARELRASPREAVATHAILKQTNGVPQVRTWRTLAATERETPIAFKDRGVYLITGGLGGLGLILAREILQQTSRATVVLAGRTPVETATQVIMTKLPAAQNRVDYRRVDVSDSRQIEQLVAHILDRHAQLNGIVHSAGVAADNFILKKSTEEFREVLASKVTGTFNLDRASRDVDLDFLVLFSSIAAVTGNAGQADYATANGFMDQFAVQRNLAVAAGERRGRTLSINWPFWLEGGMVLDERSRQSLQRSSGIQPMQTATGIRALYQCLQSPCDQVLVMEGELAQLHGVLSAQTLQARPAEQPLDPSLATEAVRPVDTTRRANDLLDRTEEYLRRQFSKVLKLPAHEIEPRTGLERYGIDSILAVSLIGSLEGAFGPLSKTLLFEYQNIHALAEYFVRSHAAALNTLFAPGSGATQHPAPAEKAVQPAAARPGLAAKPNVSDTSRRPAVGDRREAAPARHAEPIAIVGLSGRYPEAPDLQTYWHNLREGKDCIVEVPRQRWDWRDYFSEDRTQAGRHYSKWGGFIAGVDEFDPRFFHISPKEAKDIDPQERLFLKHAWLAIEDAGCTRASLANSQVGVYAGAMHSEYQLFGAEASVRGHRKAVSSSFSSIANRVSYVLNLHGPSMTLDTMCSSSLTAIHIACQDLRSGRTDLAIAGGVNVSIHPNKYLLLSAGQFISGDGHCQSFGEGGDGYIPGEGVGVVVLKRLSEAQRDGNVIYGVIRGSALNHGGKTNGYTVPNPKAQSDVIRQALADASLDPRHISYIEAHGTGTKLGDPIEITALSSAFRGDGDVQQASAGSCFIGSAKSNIGHCESAAGIAGLTKVLLQMKHGQIAPSLHSSKLNPHIDFASTPFVVNQSLREWQCPEVDGQRLPRIAGISSFGAGGSNAHVIVEEYRTSSTATARDSIEPSQVIVPLSARTPAQLEQKARDLLAFITGQREPIDLPSLAYTLQIGREALEERLGLLTGSVEWLADQLQRFVAGELAVEGLYRGQAGRNSSALSAFSVDADFQRVTEQWIADGKLSKVAECWVNGVELSWHKFYDGSEAPRLMSLPGYPFAKEQYWLTLPASAGAEVQTAPLLHPLVHKNTSTLLLQSYSSTFSGAESFVDRDDTTQQAALPQWITLEMLRAAVELASADRPASDSLELKNIVWGRPIVVTGGQTVRVAMLARDDYSIDIEITTGSGEQVVYCQGLAVRARPQSPVRLALAQLESTLRAGAPTQPGVVSCREGEGQLLASVGPDIRDAREKRGYVLHPDLLKITAGLVAEFAGQPISLQSVECVRFLAECPDSPMIWIRNAAQARVDIDIGNEFGDVCVQVHGLQYEFAEAGSLEPAAPVARAEPREIPLAAGLTEPRSMHAHAVDAPAHFMTGKVSLASIDDLQVSEAAPGTGVTLLELTSPDSATPMAKSTQSAVKLFELGNGVFSIELPAADAEPVESLLHALHAARQETALKVLLIKGGDGFWPGGRTACNRAVEQRLFSAVASFPFPVIAVAPNGARGSGFLLAGVCDLMVAGHDGRYEYSSAPLGLFPSAAEQSFFCERFGSVLADELLYRTGPWTGEQLLQKGWKSSIVPAAQVDGAAMQLASELANKPQTALRLLKEHLARELLPLVDALTVVGPIQIQSERDAGARTRIASPVPYLSVDEPNRSVAVVRIGSQPVTLDELAAGLANLFEQIERCSNYRAIVLTSAHPGFLPSMSETFAADSAVKLRRLLQNFSIPVITAFAGNAGGLAWALGLWSDACVYQAQGLYSADGLWSDPTLARGIAASFVSGLGSALGQEACLSGKGYTGIELRTRMSALTVAEAPEVLPQALSLAAFWSQWPRETIEAWKAARASRAQRTLDALPAWRSHQPKIAATSTPAAPRSDAVTVTIDEHGVAVITMHDRQAKNLFSATLLSALKQAFAYVERTPACKVIVLTGYDTYFAAGGTKETLLSIQQGKAQFTDERIFEIAANCSVPVIAAMQGHAIGAGWSLGMFADLVLLGEESRFHSPYMVYGFTPGAGATLVFPWKIGHDLARETLLTAREMAGHELRSRGLTFPIMPRRDVLPAATALAKSIARHPRERLTNLKQQWTHALLQTREDAYRREVQMHEHTIVGQSGTLENIQAKFSNAPASTATVTPDRSSVAIETAAGVRLPEVAGVLRGLLAHELHMPAEDIDESVQFTDLGLDSITGVTWIRRINERYGTSIEATKVYSYPTLAELSRFVMGEAEKAAPPGASAQLHANPLAPAKPAPAKVIPANRPRRDLVSRLQLDAMHRRAAVISKNDSKPQPIAVIGMAGQFPQARDLEEFWANIAAGRDCISEVPAKRWRLDEHYQPGEAVPGKTNSKWLGALTDYDAFDSLFFNISPTEAQCMDPQQRVFLQACWHGIENAGYDSQSLSGSRCGVFVGCAAGDYHQLPRKHPLGAQDFTGAATSILAARIAYFLNLRGPCISIDTACSSSLVAIAEACDSLNSGSSDLALAGGIYVMSGPSMHVMTAQAGMLSTDGRCFTFDRRANGFVIGEGVGVVVLKRLADAERDGDRILGVLEGWGVNQDGKTNGITAPNEESQTRLLQSVYEKFHIDPAGIQLIEAHGTGTKLGDPIEVAGLKAAFKPFTGREEYCALGSVKSSIGHCLTAAGVAGVLKLLLALKHRQLPPAANYAQCNEHIRLAGTPFYVNESLESWDIAGHEVRRAAVSSFGFSGTNAHIVIAEPVPAAKVESDAQVWPVDEKFIVPLSARGEAQLRHKVDDLLQFLRKCNGAQRLADIAYTLQVARDAMAERVVFMVGSLEELTGKLAAYAAGDTDIADSYRGQIRQHKDELRLFIQDEDVRTTMVGKWLRERKLSRLTQLWAKGLTVDWRLLYGEARPRRIELPGYPFVKERFWIDSSTPADSPTDGVTVNEAGPALLQGASRDDTVGSIAAQWDGVSYVHRWEEWRDPVRSVPLAHRTVLIVSRDASSPLEAAIREHYRQKQAEVVLVRLADETVRLSHNEWRCGVRDLQGFQTALQDLRKIDALYFLASSAQEEHSSVEAAAETQLLRLVKQLREGRKIGEQVDTYILTIDNHSLSGEPCLDSGAGAAGLGYSLAQANYRYRVRNLDLSAQDLRTAGDAAQLLGLISREPPSDRGEIVKIEAGKRYRGSFLKLCWGPPTPPPLKHNGVYLIVGGSGMVGRIITRNLMQKYGATVVWLGRSDVDSPKVREALQSFEQFGGKLLYLQADVLDEESLRRAVATIKDMHSALHGAIFSSMVFGIDNSIEQIAPAEFESVVAVKTRGGRVFHAALNDEALDFMVYFSSGQAYAFSGAATVAGYAAGISSADSFTRSIQGTTRVPVGTINWGAWRAFLKERMEVHQDTRARNVGALDDDEGFACFERFLGALQQGRIRQVLCMRVSEEVQPLINRNPRELVTLAEQAYFATPATQLRIDPPSERIAQLRRVQEASDLDKWFSQLLFHQLNHLYESSKRDSSTQTLATIAQLHERCGLLDRYVPWVNESLHMLAQQQCIELRDDEIVRWDASEAKARWQLWQTRRQRYLEDPQTKALTLLVNDCLVRLPDILRGEIAATDVIFPNSSMEKIAALYKDNAVADTFNEIVADAVLDHVQRRLQADPGTRLRILEIGAGTGGTSAMVFTKLSPHRQAIEEYCYTDLSKAFFLHAQEHYFPQNPYIVCRRLDIEQPIAAQGIDIGSYDVVIATNVLHATRDIRQTLRNAKAALRNNGLLLLNEISDKQLSAHLTVGLLDGWWLFQDPELRMPGCPGLYPQSWQRVLEQEGFCSVQFPAEQAHVLGNQIIIARSDGVIRQSIEPATQPPVAAPPVREQRSSTQLPSQPMATQRAMKVSNSAQAGDTVHSVVLQCLSSTLKVPAASIEAEVAFSDYGIDSILGVSFIKQLNERLGISLNTAIIFEYSSLSRLGKHIVATFGAQIGSQLDSHLGSQSAAQSSGTAEAATQPLPASPHHGATSRKQDAAGAKQRPAPGLHADIAVIGMSGRLPKAEDLRQFWNNLMTGVDGVEELPKNYLDPAKYSPRKQKGRTRCKWGGVLAERDCFDPLFFNISPNEAESMNPHQRLVMQESWNALEDAGYNPKALAGTQTGVFVGAEPTGYQGETFTGLSEAIIASRLSYVLNLNGPAFVVNTGCSSSGVAIHLACESLRNAESDLALAGGVHACMSQTTQIRLDEIEMVSPSGRCFTFDAQGDGTIISEGIGMVVLKRLADAIADGDHIYGVIKGSGVNQDGASNGITAPNGAAQEQLIRSVYDKFLIDPERISYIEAHGTGTKLGDPVETNALVRAFKHYTGKQDYCAVGSAKSHVGHTAAAAGVTGLIKVLLSMQHRQLPKLLNFRTLNPLIEFEQSPFFVVTENSEWQPAGNLRMAAINSFGHSGTNVHMVVEEHVSARLERHSSDTSNRQVAVPLSARTPEQLQQRCRDLLEFIASRAAAIELSSLAWTLQTGREEMAERLAFTASSIDELTHKLGTCLEAWGDVRDVYRGRVPRQGESIETDAASDTGSLDRRLQSWVQGAPVNWELLWGGAKPRRMSLPGYPFAKERYWAVASAAQGVTAEMSGTATGNVPPRDDIEDIIDRIDDDSLDPQAGVTLLKMVV